MNIQYNIIQKNDFNNSHRKIFKEMLIKQNKVKGNLLKKVDRCKMICIVTDNNNPIAIGAIKQKTASDFTYEKANIPTRSNEFNWELGYLYTDTNYIGKGIASTTTQKLIQAYDDHNLMASTEISKNPSMVKILTNNDFKQVGNTWKSSIHNNDLGLFLRIKV